MFLRWHSQHQRSVRLAGPHHHGGDAQQQRYRAIAEHVPGALPVPAAHSLSGRSVSGAVSVSG